MDFLQPIILDQHLNMFTSWPSSCSFPQTSCSALHEAVNYRHSLCGCQCAGARFCFSWIQERSFGSCSSALQLSKRLHPFQHKITKLGLANPGFQIIWLLVRTKYSFRIWTLFLTKCQLEDNDNVSEPATSWQRHLNMPDCIFIGRWGTCWKGKLSCSGWMKETIKK